MTSCYIKSQNSFSNNIIPYFKGIKAAFESKQAPYRIGVYGSGLVCDVIKIMGLASYSWLAKSSGYWGTSEYNNPEKYSIRRGCVVKLSDILFDSNSSGYAEDFGPWHFINRYPSFEVLYALVNTLEISTDYLFCPEIPDDEKKVQQMINCYNSCNPADRDILLEVIECLSSGLKNR